MTRETDYAIFERVFGGKLFRTFDKATYKPGDVLTDEAERECLHHLNTSLHTDSAVFNNRPATVAHYSESNAEAMAVLVKCGETIDVTCMGPREGQPDWYVCQGFRSDYEAGEVAPTLPEAICAFALKIFP